MSAYAIADSPTLSRRRCNHVLHRPYRFHDPAQSDRHLPLHGVDVSRRCDQPDCLQRFHQNLAGQAFVIFVLVIAAAEASLALGLVVLLFREKNTLDADAWRQLRG